ERASHNHHGGTRRPGIPNTNAERGTPSLGHRSPLADGEPDGWREHVPGLVQRHREGGCFLYAATRVDIRPHSPGRVVWRPTDGGGEEGIRDRKSTRLNSSHVKISYAVFCLKKKKRQ